MKLLKSVHHIAVLCSDYQKSKHFYSEILGLEIIRETYRAERDSYKLDLALNGNYILEVFSFPNPPARPSKPESTGLRHLAFGVENLDLVINEMSKNEIVAEDVRIDTLTKKRFTFIADPDNLPIEFYEL
ncbi:MAG: VOC family protein [Opitutaceae bacterium]|nr:VOC family protein [Cytophagales bacterium]